MYLPTSKDWCFWSELSLLGQLRARAYASVLPRFVQRVFPLKGGTLYDLIRLHGHCEIPQLLPVPPLGHKYSRMSSSAFTAVGGGGGGSPLPPDPPLGQNITCATSPAVTGVGGFLLFRLIHRWVTQVLYNLTRFHRRWEFPPLPPVSPLGCTKVVLADLVSGLRGTL